MELWPALGTALAACLVVVAGSVLVRLARLGHAAHAITWVPLPIAVDGRVKTVATRVNVTGRVLLPDGTEGFARLTRVSADLAVNVRASGRLWVIGGARANGSVVVGVPGHVLVGFGTLGRK